MKVHLLEYNTPEELVRDCLAVCYNEDPCRHLLSACEVVSVASITLSRRGKRTRLSRDVEGRSGNFLAYTLTGHQNQLEPKRKRASRSSLASRKVANVTSLEAAPNATPAEKIAPLIPPQIRAPTSIGDSEETPPASQFQVPQSKTTSTALSLVSTAGSTVLEHLSAPSEPTAEHVARQPRVMTFRITPFQLMCFFSARNCATQPEEPPNCKCSQKPPL
jgi:hypothetical protein